MPVGVMMSQMSALEEAYWMAYEKEDPFGDYRADVRNAQVLHMLYSINAGKKSEKKKITDFMPFFRKRVQKDEHVTTKVRSLFNNIIKHQD
jgi:hypothetical protein